MNYLSWFLNLYATRENLPQPRESVTLGSDDSNGAPPPPPPGGRQFLVWLACVVGILGAPFVMGALDGLYPGFLEFFGSWARLAWSALFGVILTALLFKTVLTERTPFIVQLGVALVAGLTASTSVPIAIRTLSGGIGVA